MKIYANNVGYNLTQELAYETHQTLFYINPDTITSDRSFRGGSGNLPHEIEMAIGGSFLPLQNYLRSETRRVMCSGEAIWCTKLVTFERNLCGS